MNWALRALAATVLAVAGYFLVLTLTGNFHVIIPGEFYRSGQLSSSQIRAYVSAYGIRSIINLRGENAGVPWYRGEIDTAKELNVQHFDFRMSARHPLDQDRAEELIALMASAPKPVLVHCGFGADRSGLAAALYLARVKRTDERVAEHQFSIYFGHLGFSFMPSFAMDFSFDALEPWLGYPPDVK